MAGLVPAIHVFVVARPQDVDARHKAGHDGGEVVARNKAGHDGGETARKLSVHARATPAGMTAEDAATVRNPR